MWETLVRQVSENQAIILGIIFALIIFVAISGRCISGNTVLLGNIY